MRGHPSDIVMYRGGNRLMLNNLVHCIGRHARVQRKMKYTLLDII